MTRSSDDVARCKPNGEAGRIGVVSLSSTRVATSSQSVACLVELDLSAISPPTAIGDGGAATESLLAERPQSEGGCHDGFKPYRDIVATQAYTIPSREGVPVRLPIPIRPSTGQQQLRHRDRTVGVHSARCTHPSRAWQPGIPRSKRPAAGRHTGTRVVAVAASPPPATQLQLLEDPSARTGTSRGKAGQLPASPSSSHPNRIIRVVVGGVRPHVEKGRYHHRHPQAPPTAQRSVMLRRHPLTFTPVRATSRHTTKSWSPEAPRPPLKPRPLSAPARGRAVRRAVDRCCHDLPATSELSYGAARFLRQWDGASRRQRGKVLEALADQLLAGGHRGDYEKQQQQQPRSSLLVEAQSNEGIQRAEGARRELLSGQQAQKLETPDTSEDFYSHPACVLGTSAAAFNAVDPISAKKVYRPRHGYREDQAGPTVQPAGVTRKTDYSYDNGTGFLELLGAHAGLLAARISSHLRTLHSCGHAIGLCLRVTILLAESSFETTHDGSRGSGSGSVSDSIAPSIAQQLSTPGVIRVALEIVAAKSAATPAAKTVAKPVANPTANPVRTHTGGRTSSSSPPRDDKTNRAQALRLLLILVRAGGRQIKERLTCPSSIPGADKSDDALGPILVTLRRSDCTVGTRTAAGRLLVELGVGNPAGSGRVWSAVLCVLRQDECRKANLLGCGVAHKLLSILSAGCSSSEDGHFPSGFVWSQEHRLRPDVLLVPSTLTLSLNDCSATREAAGKLVACLASVSGRCCHLLVAGLVGLLGTIYGVKQSPPIAWRRRHCEETAISRNEDELEVRWSELRQPNHRRVAEFTGRGSKSLVLNEKGIFCGVDFENPGGNTGSQQCGINNVLGYGNDFAGEGGADSSQSAENDKLSDGEPTRSAADSTDDNNHVIRAMETLRRICSGKGGEDVCLALFSTLAPLAVLRVLAGPCPSENSPSGTGKSIDTALDVADEITFITQAREAPVDCARFARGDGIQAQETPRASKGAISCDRRHPPREIEDEPIHADGGNSFPTRSSETAAGPRQALFLVAADALLAMCRCGGGCFCPTKPADQIPPTAESSPENGSTPLPFPGNADGLFASAMSEGQQGAASRSNEVLKFKRLIDAALDGCGTLSSSLRNGDATALARIFFSEEGDCYHADYREEISVLRRNVLALTKRLGAARPSPAADD